MSDPPKHKALSDKLAAALIVALHNRKEEIESRTLESLADTVVAQLQQRISKAPPGQEWIDISDCPASVIGLLHTGGWTIDGDGNRLMFPKSLSSNQPKPLEVKEVIAIDPVQPPPPPPVEAIVEVPEKNENGKRAHSNGKNNEEEIAKWKKRAQEHAEKYQELQDQIDNCENDQQKTLLQRQQRAAEEGHNFCVKAKKMVELQLSEA